VFRKQENEAYRLKREQAKVDYQNYLNEMTAKLIRKSSHATPSAANQTAAHL
jgi:hypothetical protein